MKIGFRKFITWLKPYEYDPAIIQINDESIMIDCWFFVIRVYKK